MTTGTAVVPSEVEEAKVHVRYQRALTRIQNRRHQASIKNLDELKDNQEKCLTRTKIRSLCENLTDQFLHAKESLWKSPVQQSKDSPEHQSERIKYRKGARRECDGTVFVCIESHISTVDNPNKPSVEIKNTHHVRPKWKRDTSCRTTWFARTLHFTIIIIIVASVLTFIVDSLNYEYCLNICPSFIRISDDEVSNCTLVQSENRNYPNGCNPKNNTGVPCDKVYPSDSILANPEIDYYCTYHQAKGILDDEQIFTFDVFFTIVFTLELIIRASVAETYCRKNKKKNPTSTPFFADGLNWCDFLAILPLPMQLILLQVGIDNSLKTEALEQTSSAAALSSLAIMLELFKLLRVIRVFKIARHFSGTKVMSKTIQKSFRPFRLTFIVLFLVFTVLGSALMLLEPCFGAPGTAECQFPDLFTAGYYLMITILTVGYGDYTPTTNMGRLIGIICMMLGSCFFGDAVSNRW